MSCACSAIGLAPLRYWGSPVELWGDCNLWPFTRHLFLAILLEAVVGQDGPFAFGLRACPVAGFFGSDGSGGEAPADRSSCATAAAFLGRPRGRASCGAAPLTTNAPTSTPSAPASASTSGQAGSCSPRS